MSELRGGFVLLRLLLVFAMVAPLLVPFPVRSDSCVCGQPGSPYEELHKSTLVFRGIAKSMKDHDERRWVSVEFAVLSVWKGTVAKTITVDTTEGGCGYSFVEGTEYIVYAEDETLYVTHCSRTSPIAKAGTDLAELGQGAMIDYGGDPPTPYDPADRTPLSETTWLIPIVAALIASIVGLIWFIAKRLAPRLS